MHWRTSAIAIALSVLALLGGARPAFALQKTYPIAYFSDEFRATLSIENSEKVLRRGSISVFARSSGHRLLEVRSDELSVDVKRGEASANVQELPYGQEQSVLLYEDFDFDGRRDLAIMDGQKSCYHGPSFQIFLRRGNGFAKSASFTALAHDYCGMFSIDAAAKQLFAMTKSGCCWHQFDTFGVVNHAPRWLKSVVESVDFAAASYLKRETTGAHPATEHFLLSGADSTRTPLLSFELAGPGQKRVEVFVDEGTLDYALLVGPEGRVDFSYRLRVLAQGDAPADHPFTYDAASGELSFENGAYRYVIHDSARGLGVSVQFHGQIVELPAVDQSRSGTLRGLRPPDFENVRESR